MSQIQIFKVKFLILCYLLLQMKKLIKRKIFKLTKGSKIKIKKIIVKKFRKNNNNAKLIVKWLKPIFQLLILLNN